MLETPTQSVASAAAAPSPTPEFTKPPFTQAPLAAPTYARWAVDKTGNPEPPYFLDLRVPIAGSGIFGAESCVVRARPSGKQENVTSIALDAATLERFMREAASYRVEADGVGVPTVTIPLSDSVCRPLCD